MIRLSKLSLMSVQPFETTLIVTRHRRLAGQGRRVLPEAAGRLRALRILRAGGGYAASRVCCPISGKRGRLAREGGRYGPTARRDGYACGMGPRAGSSD